MGVRKSDMVAIKPLSGIDLRFVFAFLKLGIGSQAYTLATEGKVTGPSARQRAHFLLKRDNIQAEIAKQREMMADSLKLEAQDVVKGLLYEANYFGQGASHGARVAAWTQLARHLGMFQGEEDRSDDLENAGLVININMPDGSGPGGATKITATMPTARHTPAPVIENEDTFSLDLPNG